MARVTAWVLAHRRLAVALVVLVLGFAAIGATRISLSFSSRGFYGTADEGAGEVAVLDEFIARWGPDDATLLVLAQGDDVLSAPSRAALDRLAGALRDVPGVERVMTPTELIPSGVTASMLEGTAAVPALLSSDGRRTVVVVTLETSSDDLGATVAVVEPIASVVASAEWTAGLRLTIAGVPAVRSAFFSLALRDQMILGPLVFALIGIVLAWIHRRVHAVVTVLLAAGLPMGVLVGVMGWMEEPIGLINQAFFTLLPVIAVADAVHYLARIHEERGEGVVSTTERDAAVVRASAEVGVACMLTSITTAAGLLSLLVVDVSILRRFGAFGALGVALSFVSVMVVVPLVCAWMDPRPRPRSGPPTGGWPRALAAASIRHRTAVLVGGAVVLLGAGWASSRLVVDNRLGELLDAEHPVRQASDVIDEHLGGILGLEVELAAERGVVDPATVEAVVRWSEQQPQVRWVSSPRTPGADAVREDGARVRLTLHTADIGGRAFAEFAARVRVRVQSHSGVRAVVTGTSLLAYQGVNRIAEQLRGGLLGLLVVVTLIIALAFRGLRVALLAIPVNVLPLLVGGAVLYGLGLTIDPLAAVIVAVALGIAVDDTVHIVARTREEQMRGASPSEAVLRAADSSGSAIVVSTVALGLGLGVQVVSSFPPLRLLGALGAIVLVAALLADLTVLPALLAGRRRPHDADAS